MGFRVRKSFKVMPGVRMTVSKSGLSTSVGTRGARVSVSSKGRVRRTVGIPGTGISYSTNLTSGSRSTKGRAATPTPNRSAPRRPERPAPAPPVAPTAPTAPAAVKPGLLAPKWEKELYKVIRTQQFRDLPRIAQEHPEQAPLVAALDGLMSMSDGNLPHALEALRFAWPRTENLADHPFVRRYLGSSHATVNIAEGVSATFPISHDAVGLALVELEQHAGNMSAAISTAEHLEPSQFAAVSLCELYLVAGRYADVIDMTNNLANENDPTCLLLVFRGAALRERGMLTAAREAFKEALRTHSRAAAIRHLAYFERSRIYLAEGKKAMARKDLERVLAEDATYPGVQDLLAEIIGQGRAPEPDR